MNVRSALLPLTRRYRTDLLSQRLKRLSTRFYTDTMFSKVGTSLRGNNCAQIFTNGNGRQATNFYHLFNRSVSQTSYIETERQRCAGTRDSTKYARSTGLNLRIPSHIRHGRINSKTLSVCYRRSSKREELGGGYQSAYGITISFGRPRYTLGPYIRIIVRHWRF